MDEVTIYTGKMDTIEALARSLIVASAVRVSAEPITIPLTPDNARALGRYLESTFAVVSHWNQVQSERVRVVKMAETATATMADANGKLDLALATLGEARVSATDAEAALDRAIRINRASIRWFLGCIAVLTVNMAVLWGWA